MDWNAITSKFDRVRAGETDLHKKIRGLRRRLTLLLAVVGPGIITSNVDNDAGGISVYTQAGAQYGYALLWSLIPMTIALYVTEEMCARMGVVTGKGLSDLIREEFGFRSTFFVMIAAIVVWVLVIRGTYRQVEIIFLFACVLYLSYVFSAFLAKPDWLIAAKHTVVPNLSLNSGYLLMLTGLVGTTIAPWQFFYLQAGFVEKKVGPRQYRQARADVLIGSISCMVIVFFIIVCTAATLYEKGHRDITDAAQAAAALIPLAGKGAGILFAFGLLNASLFAASILPLSTAHVICEGLGFEAGIDHKFKEAPIFYWLYTILIVVGAGIVLLPHAPLWKILIFSQVGNGFWLPVVVIFILLLVNRRDLMGEYVNTTAFNVVAWTTAIAMIILSLVLAYTAIFQGTPTG